VTSTDTKPEVVFSRRGRHLEKWIWRHIFAVGASIWTKFGSPMQNSVQISAKLSKSKPEVDFQHGGRLFFKNRSSYISAVNWDVDEFGLLIDFDLLKAAISTNAKPEIVLSGCGRHLDKAIQHHISAMAAPIWMKFDILVQNKMQITEKLSRSKPEVQFQKSLLSQP